MTSEDYALALRQERHDQRRCDVCDELLDHEQVRDGVCDWCSDAAWDGDLDDYDEEERR